MTPSSVRGTGVVAGAAHAPALWARPAVEPVLESASLPEDARPAEIERFQAAAATVAERFARRASDATGVAAEVLGATAALATDRGWMRAASSRILAGANAEQATHAGIEQFCVQLEKLGGRMAERTTDLRDIRDRVVAELRGLPEPGVPQPTSPVVLLAHDLAPADTTTLDPRFVRGLVTRLGGPTSHTAIIARQLGIPCIVAVDGLEDVEEGTPLLVDGGTGVVTLSPDPEEAERLVAGDADVRERAHRWRGPGRTADGHPVQLLANVQDGPAAQAAAAGQAEGIGLYRTELSFLTARTEPGLEEQVEVYRPVFSAFPQAKVVVRTLDAGSDKPVPFAHHEDEENPALGVRGVRLTRTNSGLLDRQLDAIAQAAREAGAADPWVMAPMVATVEEAREFARLCRERGLTPGIMVEVPSVALLADRFLEEVEFLSLGTNDLTQYTMAADRMSSPLARLTDPWQPAVLRLIQLTAEAGARAGKPVGACGEAAADPLLACVLVGLGVTSLSMAPGAIPAVGARLAEVSAETCREAAAAVLDAPDPDTAREIAARVLV